MPQPVPQPEPVPASPVPGAAGTLIGLPLPSDPMAPYNSLRGSKHTNMAADGNGRLWVSGGDWQHSATDGTWSYSLLDASCRQEIPAPVYPSLPAPHALQDGAGFVFDDYRQTFLLWPGSYFAYDAADAPIRDWARGLWFLDPKLKAYKQEPGLFGAPGSSTGCMFGGVHDPVRDEIVALADDGSAPAVVRWNLTTFAKRSIAFTVPGKPAHTAAYFAQGRYARIGRLLYAVGYITDGAALRAPLLLEVNLDTNAVRRLAAPPVPAAGMPVKVFEIRLAASHGKVVWPRVAGPDGEIDGIAVYDPAADAWTVDDQVPAFGNFIANAITELRDGRVAMCGGEFGRQQTHLWLYGAT